MHGIIRPESIQENDETFSEKLRAFAWTHRFFLLVVCLPTLVLAAYYYLIASDQYESRADFIVRRADSASVGAPGMGQLLGFEFGNSSTLSEAYLVEQYLLSHDTVARLRKEDQLVSRFRRPGTDWISRLWFADPTPETLLDYYRDQVTIEQDTDTGISHLRVHTFDPEDSYRITQKLLLLGEQRINALNQRTFTDQVETSARELADAENALIAVQAKLTGFRRLREDIDPEGTGKAQIGMVTSLTGELVAARAKLRAMDDVISRNSPQYRALAAQVSALEGQVSGQSARLAGQDKSIATTLGDYEDLVIRREHAAKRYSAAAALYDQARAEANRKQLYLVRVVDANRPVKSLFPERGRIVLTWLAGLLVFYLVGKLLISGVREHHL